MLTESYDRHFLFLLTRYIACHLMGIKRLYFHLTLTSKGRVIYYQVAGGGGSSYIQGWGRIVFGDVLGGWGRGVENKKPLGQGVGEGVIYFIRYLGGRGGQMCSIGFSGGPQTPHIPNDTANNIKYSEKIKRLQSK